MSDSSTTEHEENNQYDDNVTLTITRASARDMHEPQSYYLGAA